MDKIQVFLPNAVCTAGWISRDDARMAIRQGDAVWIHRCKAIRLIKRAHRLRGISCQPGPAIMQAAARGDMGANTIAESFIRKPDRKNRSLTKRVRALIHTHALEKGEYDSLGSVGRYSGEKG